MIRGVLIFIISWISVTITYSQTAPDAIRLGFNQYLNSARSAGVAGAFGSLGADINVANINPAGIGEFRKSEIVVGGNYVISDYTSRLGETSVNDSNSKFQLGTAAGIFHANPQNFDTKTMNIAIGVNQLASYSDNFTYEGTTGGTIVDRWLDLAQGLRVDELDPFETGPAFDAEAILEQGQEGVYDSGDFITFQEQLFRSESVDRSGYMNEAFITLGSNYKNKLSWGLTLGIPFYRFEEFKIYREIDQRDEVSFFNQLLYRQQLEITGTGVNLKGGVIYKITPQIRVGASIHSPTVFAVSDSYSTDLVYDFTFESETFNLTGNSGVADVFEYQITTPWRALLGLSYLYKVGDLKGFVSGDVEFLNYSNTKYSPAEDAPPGDEAIFNGVNQELDTEGASAMNIRLGTEIAYNHFRVRVGAVMNGSPYTENATWNPDLGFSGGIGYRAQSFYIDAAYSVRPTQRNYQPYRIDASRPQQNVDLESTLGVASLTIGFKI